MGGRPASHEEDSKAHHDGRQSESPSHGRLGDQPDLARIHAPEPSLRGKPHARMRPDVRRWFLAEQAPVAGEGGLIPIVKFVRLSLAALGGTVMQGLAQHITAQVVPVAPCVDHVQVPRLVHFFAGCHRVACPHRQIHEPAVFLHDPHRKGGAPSIFTCQPLG